MPRAKTTIATANAAVVTTLPSRASARAPKRKSEESDEKEKPATKRAKTAASKPAAETTKKVTLVKKAAPKKEPAPKKEVAKKVAAPKTKAAPKKAAPKKTVTREAIDESEDDSAEESAPEPAVSQSYKSRFLANHPQPKKTKIVAAPKKAAAPKAAAPKAAKLGPVINETPTQKLDIYVFGEGSQGELGLGATKHEGKSPVDVKRPRINHLLSAASVGVVQIAVGGMHCAALTHDSRILSWGVNDQGALGRETEAGPMKDLKEGDDDSSDSDEEETGLNATEAEPREVEPKYFPTGTKFAQLAASDSATFALTTTGLVYGWGTFRVSCSIPLFGTFKLISTGK